MTSLRIERVDLIRIAMQMHAPFRTSFGTLHARDIVLVRVVGDGVEGYGEFVAEPEPLFNEETIDTGLQIMRAHLLPRVIGKSFSHPSELAVAWAAIRRNNMAKAAIELAFWDAWARARDISLSQAMGGVKAEIAVGVSIGIQESVPMLLSEIERFVDDGYQRIKVKIEPGWDVEVVDQIRRRFPDIPLMVDANAAYTLSDVDHLRRLDDYSLMMIEQPLAHDDIFDHARLQEKLSTPICLDESITSAETARRALELGSCRIINIKTGRVGGHVESIAVHDLCASRDIPVWCGGMLESGIGRLHNVALGSLPGFTLPGDTSPSSRYFAEDIIDPPVTMSRGIVQTPEGPGIGHSVRKELIDRLAVSTESFRPGDFSSG